MTIPRATVGFLFSLPLEGKVDFAQQKTDEVAYLAKKHLITRLRGSFPSRGSLINFVIPLIFLGIML